MLHENLKNIYCVYIYIEFVCHILYECMCINVFFFLWLKQKTSQTHGSEMTIEKKKVLNQIYMHKKTIMVK